MPENPLELVLVHELEEAFRGRHDGMLGIAPRREGVRRLLGNDRHARHRDARLRRERTDDPVELGRFGLGDETGAGRRQHHPVREEVREQVHAAGEYESENRPLGAAHELADAHEEDGHERHEEDDLERVHAQTSVVCSSR